MKCHYLHEREDDDEERKERKLLNKNRRRWGNPVNECDDVSAVGEAKHLP